MDPSSAAQEETPTIYRDRNFRRHRQEIDDAIHQNNKDFLRYRVEEIVNLSKDPLLNVVIAYNKTDLAIEILKEIPNIDQLRRSNYDGDTALHVAARKGDVRVAKALIEREKELVNGRDEQQEKLLVNARNKQLETPLHKAALYGEEEMFRLLVKEGSDAKARRENGATVLHSAIMGNAPRLALEIAKDYPPLMTTRNDRAVTPLQLMVTIPDAFRSKLSLGYLSELIYDAIPLEDGIAANMTRKGDVEKQVTDENSDQSYWPHGDAAERAGIRFLMRHRSKFPPNYATFFDLLTTAWIPVSIAVRWIRLLLFRILKQMFSGVGYLEQQKRKHKQVMELVRHLAEDPDYWDFIVKGRTAPSEEEETADSFRQRKPAVYSDDTGKMTRASSKSGDIKNSDSIRWSESPSTLWAKMGLHEFVEQILEICRQSGAKSNSGDTKNSDSRRWDESPLTLGAKMGLHEFVEQILNVCPQSAIFLDFEGRNILQVAIQNGQEKIVGIIEPMVTGSNPKLPSWLLSSIDKNTKNTILHFAAEKKEKIDVTPLQMQTELQWFERVKKLVPKDLEYSRNESEKTAQELFTENHKDMVKVAKAQLVEIGKTCSSLVTAVVFASSFSIPGDRQNGNPTFYHKTAFKVFSHAYVVGLSCASTALVLFLTFLNSPYREHDFRRSLPTRYFFAYVSLFLSLVALLVAFSCNIYLNIYGGRKAETSEILPLVCELTIFPALCIFVLLYRGSSFGLGSFLRHFWR